MNTGLEWYNLKYLSIVRYKYFHSVYHSIITGPIEKNMIYEIIYSTVQLFYHTTQQGKSK